MIGPYTEVVDRQVQEALDGELERQRTTIELIASENFASPAVLAAQGSVLTNKYAEGYPGKRYYGGCEQVDKVEVLAIERAKELFGAEHVNVQPHSGSQANEAAYAALIEPGDKVLSMGGRIVGIGLAEEILETFLTTDFEGGRHEKRVEQIADIETTELQEH